MVALNKIKYRTSSTASWNNFLDLCYPIGSVILGKNITPGTLFGGTWTLQSDKNLYLSSTVTDSTTTNRSVSTTQAITFASTQITGAQSPRINYTPSSGNAYLIDTGSGVDNGEIIGAENGYHTHELTSSYTYNGTTYERQIWGIRKGHFGVIKNLNTSTPYTCKFTNSGAAYITSCAYFTNIATTTHTHNITWTAHNAGSAHAAGVSVTQATVAVNRVPTIYYNVWKRTA